MTNKSGLWNATFGEIGATLKVLEDNGVSLELFASLRSNHQLAKDVSELMKGKGEKVTMIQKKVITEDEFLITVDYSWSLEEMIAIGNYDGKNKNNISKDSSVTSDKQEEVIVKLFHFNTENNHNHALTVMDKNGYRCGVLFELLALDQAKPELRSKFSIVALGSKWKSDGSPCLIGFPYLCLNDNKLKTPLQSFLRNDFEDNTFCYLGIHK